MNYPINFENVLLENVNPKYINSLYPKELLIWITSSGGKDNRSGFYQMIMQCYGKKEYYESKVEGATANQAAIEGIKFAINKIKKPSKVHIVVSTNYGFESALKNKGTNASRIVPIYELLIEKECSLTEIVCPGMAKEIKNYIIQCSGKENLLKEHENKIIKKQEYVASYTDKVKKEIIKQVIDILINENVNDEIINKITTLI